MNTLILDKYPAEAVAFRPRSIEEVVALHLARKLDDEEAAAHYAQLAGQHPIARLLMAYRLALRVGQSGGRSRLFHAELSHLSADQPLPKSRSLLALRVEPRCVAAAVFKGTHLDYTERRQLGFSKHKALGGAARFVSWLLDTFPADSAALETVPGQRQLARREVSSQVETTLLERLLSVHRIPQIELFAAFGQPQLRSRGELRAVTTGIWPILKATGRKVLIQDAAALGLHVQIERLFQQP